MNRAPQMIVNLHDNERVNFASLARALGISREKVTQLYNSEKHPVSIKPKRVEPVYPPDALCNVCGESYETHDIKSFVARPAAAIAGEEGGQHEQINYPTR